ncbi:MAG: DUF924 family protein [Kiloniellaceae bacterium]
MSALQDILGFWFAEGRQEQWFKKSEAFDAEVRRLLLPHLEAALAGKYESWRREPQGCLALVLLLDQVPRNVYRDTPRAFATDPAARAVTRHALAEGFDRALATTDERMFLYLPLEHSEDLRDQQDCVRLVGQMEGAAEYLSYAERHRDIIARFGRCPHRNAILGRESTEAELEFLKQPNSSF